MPMPPADVEPPSHEALVRDLAHWREQGVLKLRRLDLLALRQAALACGDVGTGSEAAEPAALTELVRASIATMAGSATGRCAVVLLGLDPYTFDVKPSMLREEAAEIWGVTTERFRREPQAQVLATVADKILERCYSHRARLVRLSMEQRHPAETRLAVKWLERFEAYFRLWTQIYALGADLTAYRSTLLEEDRPWDRSAGTEGPEDPGYSQELQAAGYGTDALFRLTCVTAEEDRFVARYGGLWLLSTADAEVEARDALAAVTRRVPTNERDHSWLRSAIGEAGDEIHLFLTIIQGDAIGRALHDEWQVWLGTCSCRWQEESHDPSIEYFPTARYHGGIEAACRVHRTIEACTLYCAVIEAEWLRVADWYSIVPVGPLL
jgi:hypothetical protein